MRHLYTATFLFTSWCWREADPTCQDDLDGDGFAACEDCDDLDAAINPDAEEVDGNCLDENCDDYYSPAPETEAALAAGGALLCGEGTEEAGSALYATGTSIPDATTLLVGAPRRDASGTVYLLDTAAMRREASGQLLPLRELATLSISGAPSYEAGTSVSALDLDGDQSAEVVVGAPGVSVNGIGNFGAVFLVPTEGLSGTVSLQGGKSNQCPDNASFCLVNVDAAAARLGTSVLAGHVDPSSSSSPFLLVSAPGYKQERGAVLLIRGSGSFDERLVLGDSGVQILSGERFKSGLGMAMAVGPLDGDGVLDALVGAPGLNLSSLGLDVDERPFVGGVYGLPLELSDVWEEGTQGTEVSADELLIHGETEYGRVGAALATGDLSGAGATDVAVSTHCTEAPCTDAVWIVPQDQLENAPLAIESMHTLEVIWEGPDDLESISFPAMPPRLEVADVDGDGQDDLIIGRPAAEDEAGTTYIVYGPRQQVETLDLDSEEILDVTRIGPTMERECLGFALEGGAAASVLALGAPRGFDGGGAIYGYPAETFSDDR